MHNILHMESEQKVLEANRKLADENAELLEKHGVKAVDFTGAIGSGKTQIIENLIEEGKKRGIRCGAIAGDSSGNDDYMRFKGHGVPADNINTGKECHLDAHLIEHSLGHMDLESIDFLFIENVGNLLCPSDFPLGTDMRFVVISTTEGDDMVRKHPNIFSLSDGMILNKTDLAELVNVSVERVLEDFSKVAPHGKVFLTDAKSGRGIEELANHVFREVEG